MSNFWARFRDPNGKTLYAQKRSLNPGTFFAYILWKVFNMGKKFPSWGWYDFTDMSNKIYMIKSDLNWHAEEMQRLIKEIKYAEDYIKVEKEKLKKDYSETIGHSAPFLASKKDFTPIGLDIKDPGDAWKKVVKENLWGGGRKTASGNDWSKRNPEGGERHTFFPEDLAMFNVDLNDFAQSRGADSGSTWKPSKGKQQQNDGSFDPYKRKRQHGETPEGHSERLRKLQNGDDISNWQPH